MIGVILVKKPLFIKKFIILIAALLIGCNSTEPTQEVLAPVSLAEPEKEHIELTVTAVGDNLIHSPIYNQAHRRTGGNSYDFKPAYINVTDYIDSDINIINQETPIGGTELGISSYPTFNSPYELGEDIIAMGFNVINHANNHVYDAGPDGVTNSMNFWQEKNIPVLGMHPWNSDDGYIVYVEKKGIKVALLAYTYGTNSGLPKECGYAVNRMNYDKISDDLKEARENSDLVILSLHFGGEYSHAPDQTQEKYVYLAAENNVDLLIGHHPHVIQKAELVTRSDGEMMPVYYSLGNFISSQDIPQCMIGGMAKVKFIGTEDDMKLDTAGFLPVINHFELNYFATRNFLWRDYTPQHAESHGLASDGFSYAYAENLINKTIDREFLENGEKLLN